MANKITKRDLKSLVLLEISFLSYSTKKKIISKILSEEKNLNDLQRRVLYARMYNVFKIFSRFGSDRLFQNGRVVFRHDKGKIYRMLAAGESLSMEAKLFNGCVIYKENSNTYINLNLDTADTYYDHRGRFDFHKLVENAISRPDESITINTVYDSRYLKDLI